MFFRKTIEKMYRKMLYSRCDDYGDVFYFSAADFPGLESAAFSFPSKEGNRLQGYFYAYENPIANRLVIFDHGRGAGHRAYMREIELLARHGYQVFAYDHTGCIESEGEGTNGFAQSLSDLDAALCAVKAKVGPDTVLSVIGHSWGAFSTMNITALHPEVRHLVAISGFISVREIQEQIFSGLLRPFRSMIYGIETAANPNYVTYHAVKSLQKTEADVLLIYASDDPIVKKNWHFTPLQQSLQGRKNIRFLLVDGKGHNPNYTADAVKYKDDFFAKLQAFRRKKNQDERAKQDFIAGFDWMRMTEQDDAVWSEIFATLNR